MQNIFDFNAQADKSVVGGVAADAAVGSPVQLGLPGNMAPGGSGSTAEGVLAQMQQRTLGLRGLRAPQAAPPDPVVGYNPDTKQVFSDGKVFSLDLDQGVSNAPLLDVHNEELPGGFVAVRGRDLKAKLAKEYEDLGLVDSFQRRFGQAVGNVGSALQDVGAQSIGQGMQDWGGSVARANPSKISGVTDMLEMPGTTVMEAVGEAAYDLPVALAQTSVGATIGAAAGAIAAPFTGGVSIPIGALLGGFGARFLGTFVETYGSVRSEQRAKGLDERGRAGVASAGSAALEALLGPEALAGNVLARGVGKNLGLKAAIGTMERGTLKALGKGMAASAIVEGPLTEVPQTAMERWGARNDLTGAEAVDEYAVAGVKGGIGGSAMHPVQATMEFRQAKNFIENLKADISVAGDVTAKAADRLAAAKRAQDVLRGASDDPVFDQQLQEFRQKLEFIDAKIAAQEADAAAKKGLAEGTAVNLMDLTPGAEMEADPDSMGFRAALGGVAGSAEADTASMEFRAALGGPLGLRGGMPVSTELTDMQRMSAMGPQTGAAPDTSRPVSTDLTDMQRMFAMGPQTGAAPQVIAAPVTQPTPFVPASGAPLENITAIPSDPASEAMRMQLAGPLMGGRLVAPSEAVPPTPPAAGVVQSPVSPLGGDGRSSLRPQPTPSGSSSVAGATEELFPGPRTVEDALAEDNDLLSLIERISDEDVPVLRAETTTQESKKVPGRPSMPEQVYATVRDMLLHPGSKPRVRKKGSPDTDTALTQKYAEKAKAIAAALTDMYNAYSKYTNLGGNLARTNDRIKNGKDENVIAGDRVAKLQAASLDVQSALARLGDAVDGNAKDVEVIVRLIKDRVHRGSRDPAHEKLDTMLSQAWAAAKRDSYRVSPDLMDVRNQQVRPSKEGAARGAQNPLVSAAAEGYAVHGNKDAATGIVGVLNYLRSHGTPWERTLARAVSYALRGNPPNLVFDAKGPRYNPKTDTIYLSETATPEVTLHEALHGALQWYVYGNPQDADVVSLKAAVRAVVGYDSSKLGAKAVEVQRVLRKVLDGKSKTAELDAVLELISYGNTLGEFRRALQTMPTKVTPRSFVEHATSVWRMILAVTRKMLGVSDTMANEVIEATISLLETAGAVDRAPVSGNILRADVASLHTAVEGDIAASPFQSPFTRAQMVQFNQKLLPSTPTQYLFTTHGWWNKAMDFGARKMKPVHEAVNQNMPRLSKWLRWLNSHYGQPQARVDVLIRAKDDLRGGTAVFSAIGQYFTSLPAPQAVAVLEYLDARIEYLRGNTPAPVFPDAEFTKDKTGSPRTAPNVIRGLADATADMWWKFAKDLRDDTVRVSLTGVPTTSGGKTTYRNGVRFSQSLAHVKGVKDLASRMFGARNLGSLIARRVKTEVNGDAIVFNKDAAGSPDLDDQFIGLYEVTPDLELRTQRGESLDDIQPHAFISAKLYRESGLPTDRTYKADPTYLWDIRKHGDGGFRMTAKLDAKQALLTGKAINLSHALQNTMEILARSYSANRLADGMVDLGRDEVTGEATPSAVVFDSLQHLNAVLNGNYAEDGTFTMEQDQKKWTKVVKESSVTDISEEESKSAIVKEAYRSRARWVRLPSSETYGAMAGKIVSGDVWSAIEDMSDRRPLVDSQMYNNTIRWFKKAKTVYSPMTWGTNVATNVTMAFMDDIPMATLAKAARLYALYQTAPHRLTLQEQNLMLEIMKTNALLGNFTSAEVRQALYETMRDAINDDQPKLSSTVMQFFKIEHGRQELVRKHASKVGVGVDTADRIAEEWYAGQDNIFRVASMLNQLGQVARTRELTSEDYRVAGDHARFAFLDYDIDSKAVRIARQTALPFVSWPYAMAKLLGNIAVHRPWKLVNTFLAMYLIEGILQAMSGDDDEEDEAKRKSGPEWARKRLLGISWMPHTHLRVPFVGSDQNPVYYDLGRYVPVHSYSDSIPNSFMGVKGWPSVITPSSPFIGGTVALVAGVDPFTGNKLAPPTAGTWENATARAKYIASMFTPNIPLVNPAEFAKFDEAVLRGRVDKTDNHAALYMARMAGMRFYDFNVDASRQAQSNAAAAIMRKYKSEIGRLRRAEHRYETPDWDRFTEKQNELYTAMREEINEARGED